MNRNPHNDPPAGLGTCPCCGWRSGAVLPDLANSKFTDDGFPVFIFTLPCAECDFPISRSFWVDSRLMVALQESRN